MGTIFEKITDFIIDGRIDIRKEIIIKFVELKGNERAIRKYIEEMMEYQEDDGVKSEYSAVLDILT